MKKLQHKFKIPAFAGMTVLGAGMTTLLFAGMTVWLVGCASIIEGSSQTLSVATVPSFESACTVKGSDYTKEFSAPGSVIVPKSQYPIEITCVPKNGSAAGVAKVLSDISNWGYGGAVAGLGVGAAIDASTGAANEYPPNIAIPLGQTTKIGETSMNKNADFNK